MGNVSVDTDDRGTGMAVIVTAEDDEDLRSVTTRVLRRAGHTVIATADGAEGLAAVHEHLPDIVVTDVDMPRRDGLQLCRAIRDDRHLRHTPVVVISGSTDLDEAHVADAGVTAVLAKPCTPQDLLRHLAEVLAHPSTARPGT